MTYKFIQEHMDKFGELKLPPEAYEDFRRCLKRRRNRQKETDMAKMILTQWDASQTAFALSEDYTNTFWRNLMEEQLYRMPAHNYYVVKRDGFGEFDLGYDVRDFK